MCVDINNWSSIDGDTDECECRVGLFVSVVDNVGGIVEGERDGKKEIIVWEGDEVVVVVVAAKVWLSKLIKIICITEYNSSWWNIRAWKKQSQS